MNRSLPLGALLLALPLAFSLAACHSAPPPSSSQGPTSFATPAAAAEALDHALQGADVDALQHLFGPNAGDLVSSGASSQDQSNDQRNHQLFLANYKQMNRLASNPDGSVTLYLGAENWPFPVPIVQNPQHAGQWSFDSAAGLQEVLARRVGRNEAAATAVCQQLIAAQSDYHSRRHAYAQHFVSDPGTQDGLFWSAGASDAAAPAANSPIGPLLAFASLEGAAKAKRTPTPFHGYYYRMVKGHAPTTYAFVAYPADYRSSGVMTFWVNQSGVVYQDDLGPDSATAAKALTASSPGPGWQAVQSNN